MMVARVWAEHGLQPHRLEYYMASDDPDFEAKAADIIGLVPRPSRACGGVLRRRKDRDSGLGPPRPRITAVARAGRTPRV